MQKEIIMKIVLCAFFIVLFSLFSYAQEKIETYSEVLEDGKVNIYYDLKGDPSEEYEIKLNLRRTSNPEFKYSPDDLEGDYGTGKYATGISIIVISAPAFINVVATFVNLFLEA
jgi:hypothetical protein